MLHCIHHQEIIPNLGASKADFVCPGKVICPLQLLFQILTNVDPWAISLVIWLHKHNIAQNDMFYSVYYTESICFFNLFYLAVIVYKRALASHVWGLGSIPSWP